MNKKIFTPCEIEIVKIENAEVISTSPSFSCPTDGLSCTSDTSTCDSESIHWSNETDF